MKTVKVSHSLSKFHALKLKEGIQDANLYLVLGARAVSFSFIVQAQ